MPRFLHRGFDFHYIDGGAGVPFVFQHGLGGSAGQIAEMFPAMENARLICLDCRNHGDTQPSCAGDRLGFAIFGRDVQALLDHLQIGRAFFGGVSMGAGVSIRIALDNPDRVAGLLSVRPAWLDGPMPAHRWYTAVARLLAESGTQARELMAASEPFRALTELSPDAAVSLLRQFDAPQAVERAARLDAMAMDSPIPDLASLKSLQMRAHVIATERDPIHPLGLAKTLAAELPNATFQEITSKSADLARHMDELRAAIAQFWILRD